MTMITDITDMPTLQAIAAQGSDVDWSPYGSARIAYNGDLVLFSYSEHAQFEGRWNWFEIVSRGLILNWRTGEIVARPFDKFFNYGEGGRVSAAEIVSATEKLDGSLGILYRVEEEGIQRVKIATRGAFMSVQALWATEWLNAHVDVALIPNEYTLLFEIIYPDNRIVVNYGERAELVLIGIRNRFTGSELSTPELRMWATTLGLSMPITYEFRTVAEATQALKALDVHHEGWVCVFADGQRFKFKGDAYLIVHKFISGVSFAHVLDAVEGNLFDVMIDGIPDEFLGEARQFHQQILDEIEQHRNTVSGYYTNAMQSISASATPDKGLRKEYALWVKTNVPMEYTGMMFHLFDQYDITPIVYKHIRKLHKGSEPPP